MTVDQVALGAKRLGMAQFREDWLAMLSTRLAAEHARDLSDAEIDRCFDTVCRPTWCSRTAKMYRDCGYMTEEHIRRSGGE